MLAVGQRVLVISDKGIAYDATIIARATDEDGRGAYKVAMHGLGPDQLGQWHRATDVFLPELSPEDEEEKGFLDNYLKG